jgi:hypothetical protein
MAKTLEQTEGLSAPDAKVLTDIQAVGWHVVGVFPREHEEGPHWAFSVGLSYTFGHPEVILLGLPLQSCMSVLNVIGAEIKAGRRYEPGPNYSEILQEPYRCTFKEVHPNHYRNYVGYALWFYEDDAFPLVQCFWPDKEGRFPWEEGCNEDVKNSQPLLFLR